MTPKALLTNAIDPANAFLEKQGVHSDDRARVLEMTIWGQESDWRARRQIGGPARGFPQFEKGGGVAQLFAATPLQLRAVCDELFIPYNQSDVFEAMAWNDVLSAAMTRLLLWQDPAPLPAVGDVQAGWNYYQRNWRPGAPHPNVWPAKYGTAMGLVQSAKVPFEQLRSAVGGMPL